MSRTERSPYDEARDASGAPRPLYDALLAAVEEAGPAALRDAVRTRMAELGTTFGTGADTETYNADPVPRLVDAAEWDALAAGLDQRVRALNAFVVDAYGPRRLVTAGVMDDEVITRAEGYEPALQGRLPEGVVPVALAGLDIVRDPEGRFLVLEDNCRAPSGFAYVMALRDATLGALPTTGLSPREVAGPVRELLTAALRDAAPPGVDDPLVVVLTDGPQNVAHWEHATLAELTGATLLTPADLERRGPRLHARLPGGERPVDVLYRRCDEDRMTGDDGRPTLLAELVTEPWLAGTLGLVNGLGTGVADDKLVHAHVEELIRFYLGEEPLLRSVPTLDLRRPAVLASVQERLEDHVVKPRGGYGGHGVVVAGHAEPEDVEALRVTLDDAPAEHVAQETVQLSTLPAVVDPGVLASRHVDLRPFTFSGRGWTRTLPGGLTRVAMDEGALVVNSSQDGGAKDTWVVG